MIIKPYNEFVFKLLGNVNVAEIQIRAFEGCYVYGGGGGG